MAFVERQINITITLQSKQGIPSRGIASNPNPTFKGENTNVLNLVGGGPASLNGLRIAAKVSRSGSPGYSEANIQIFNLPKKYIDQLGTLGTQFTYAVGGNLITISAGSIGSTPSVIFNGVIIQAYNDFSGIPESVFNITAQSFALQGVAPAQAQGYKGSSRVDTILKNLCSLVNIDFKNNFPSGTFPPYVKNQYLSGPIRDQIRAICESVKTNMTWYFDDVKNALIIWPNNGTNTVSGATVPLIAPPPQGSMVGYPSYTQSGIKVRTEFSGDIDYGSTVNVKSSLAQASGTWVIYYMDYDLETQNPDGPWYTNLEMGLPGLAVLPAPAGQ